MKKLVPVTSVRMVYIHPNDIALETDNGLGERMSCALTFSLRRAAEKICIENNLRGYINLDKQFVRV